MCGSERASAAGEVEVYSIGTRNTLLCCRDAVTPRRLGELF